MSSINPNNIDGTFPVAAQDNDSQGFRNNFTNIKNNLNFAKTEIQDIQDHSLVTRPLIGANYGLNNINLNEFNNGQLKGVQCVRFTETMVDLGSLSGTVVASWAQAHHQLLEITGAVDLQFTGWPASGFYTKLALQVTVPVAGYTLTLPESVSINLTNIQGVEGEEGGIIGRTINFVAAGIYEFEFSTYDGGETIAIADLTNNYQKVTGIFDVTGDVTVGNDLYVAGNLTVVGTVTAIQSATLDVTDKNITVALGAVDNASADGAGITVAGSNATITYTAATDTWNLNKRLIGNLTGNVTGNLTGNVTGNSAGTHTGPVIGNLTGNITGNSAGTHTGPVIGNLTGNITGNVTGSVYAQGGRIFLSNGTASSPSIAFYNDGAVDTGFYWGGDGYINISNNGVYSGQFQPNGGLALTGTITADNFAGTHTGPVIGNVTGSATTVTSAQQPAITSVGVLTSLTTSGTIMLTGSENLIANAAASITNTTSFFTTATASVATLAAGVAGQIKIFAAAEIAGNMVVTVTNAGWKTTGPGTMTFSNIGSGCTLQYVNSKWYCIGNNGAVFA